MNVCDKPQWSDEDSGWLTPWPAETLSNACCVKNKQQKKVKIPISRKWHPTFYYQQLQRRRNPSTGTIKGFCSCALIYAHSSPSMQTSWRSGRRTRTAGGDTDSGGNHTHRCHCSRTLQWRQTHQIWTKKKDFCVVFCVVFLVKGAETQSRKNPRSCFKIRRLWPSAKE